MKKIIAMLLCCVLAVTMCAGMTVFAGNEDNPNMDQIDGYYAYLGVQTDGSWIFRNAVCEGSYGYGLQDSTSGVVAFDGLYIAGAEAHNAGIFTDAKLDGNGNYTVTLTDPDFGEDTNFSQIFVSTNVPIDSGITFSNVKVRMNNKTVWEEAEAYLNPDFTKYTFILLHNQWNAERNAIFQITEPCNTTSIEVSFDVSGFDYDKVEETVEEPAVDDTADTAEGGCTGAVAFPAVAAVVIAAALVIFKKRA